MSQNIRFKTRNTESTKRQKNSFPDEIVINTDLHKPVLNTIRYRLQLRRLHAELTGRLGENQTKQENFSQKLLQHKLFLVMLYRSKNFKELQ